MLHDAVVERLEAAGCVAADEEAAMLRESAGDDSDALARMVARREAGEPVEWIVGWAPFCGLRVRIAAGVYVPRAQTEVLARRAAELLPAGGTGVDLATGSGAVAMVMVAAQPAARVIGTEVDPVAAACARTNGVDVLAGDLEAPLPRELIGRVDVLTANVPYVPTGSMHLLPRDVRGHEPVLALDGGVDGLAFVRRVLTAAPRWLRPVDGQVLVEIGPDQVAAATSAVADAGLVLHDLLVDDDGDVRALEAGVAAPPAQNRTR